jgi:NADPH:quinone reductase-like Zn-dependent oxidoreductase
VTEGDGQPGKKAGERVFGMVGGRQGSGGEREVSLRPRRWLVRWQAGANVRQSIARFRGARVLTSSAYLADLSARPSA